MRERMGFTEKSGKDMPESNLSSRFASSYPKCY